MLRGASPEKEVFVGKPSAFSQAAWGEGPTLGRGLTLQGGSSQQLTSMQVTTRAIDSTSDEGHGAGGREKGNREGFTCQQRQEWKRGKEAVQVLGAADV